MSNYETSQTSDLKELINKLRDTQTLSKNEWIRLIDGRTPELADYLFENAREVQITHYGHDVYVRGLIEFTKSGWLGSERMGWNRYNGSSGTGMADQ